MSNYFAQTEALMHGKTQQKKCRLNLMNKDLTRAKFLLPFKVFAGNKPTNTILIEINSSHLGL
jgi:glucose-6-phosphate isomerase